jgi:hypothetical protein
LRTGSSAGPEADRQIKEILARANQLLDVVDRNVLSDDGKANYDSAKDSIRRAHEALKGSNWVLARGMAESAENIARSSAAGETPRLPRLRRMAAKSRYLAPALKIIHNMLWIGA